MICMTLGCVGQTQSFTAMLVIGQDKVKAWCGQFGYVC